MRQRADRHLPTVREEERLRDENLDQVLTELAEEAKEEEGERERLVYLLLAFTAEDDVVY